MYRSFINYKRFYQPRGQVKMGKEVKSMYPAQIWEGVNGIKKAYELTLKAAQVDIVCLSQNYAHVLGDYFDKEYSPKLYNNERITREILPGTTENREYARNTSGVHQWRFIETVEKSESDMLICGEKVFLISFDRKEPKAIVIEDKELVMGFKVRFENLWERLE